MHDRVDVEARKDLREAVRVARIADHEVAVENGLPKPSRQVVEDDDTLAGVAELPNDVGADVARAAGHKNYFIAHRVEEVT